MARFTKAQRLLTSRDFDRVLDGTNTKVVCSDFVLVASSKDSVRPTRLGLIVSSKVGNAVVRNRIKRSLRCVFRTELVEEPALIGRDLVIIARPAIAKKKERTQTNIQDTLRRCIGRLVKELK